MSTLARQPAALVAASASAWYWELLTVLLVLIVVLTIAAGLIWFERRLLSLVQDRYGPNRVGPVGLLQVLADTIKILFKEDWIAAVRRPARCSSSRRRWC